MPKSTSSRSNRCIIGNWASLDFCRQTLAGNLNSHGRHVDAARALGIHRNTLRYRLATREK
ncbi:helix-turn-helix domain-containing protein [Brenneria sp. 4F2]|nr:helix-turn-helix domain-containing protein [Brenneria bubanii]